ncbi:MAG: hypothetical protein K2L88_06845, partial [Clostridiales bacterium]|nr:hypothetical protein [Clostridiales bacterium]
VKNPHEQSEYVKVDEPDTSADGVTENAEQSPATDEYAEPTKKAKAKKKLSGAYYYVDKDEERLAAMSFARTTLTIIAFLLQMVALLFPEQAGAMYVSNHIASLGLFYVLFTIFGMGCVSIWLMVMNQIRYKIQKRIVAEYAPKNGFKNRAYFGQELYMASMAVMAVFQLSFVCIRFDGWGLGAFLVCLASLAAAVAARQLTHITLKDAELVQNAE